MVQIMRDAEYPETLSKFVSRYGDYSTLYDSSDRSIIYHFPNAALILKIYKDKKFRPPQKDDFSHDTFVHPNLVRLVETGSNYHLLEYASGDVLGGLINNKKDEWISCTDEQKLKIAMQILRALDHLHSRRVVHTDLTSWNIFLRDMAAKVSDYDNVCLERELNARPLASDFYAAPEQIIEEDVDRITLTTKTDIYSFGAVFYKMLFGLPPARAYLHDKRGTHSMCWIDPLREYGIHEHNQAFEDHWAFNFWGIAEKISNGEVSDHAVNTISCRLEYRADSVSRELSELFSRILNKDLDKRPTSNELLRILPSLKIFKQTKRKN